MVELDQSPSSKWTVELVSVLREAKCVCADGVAPSSVSQCNQGSRLEPLHVGLAVVAPGYAFCWLG